MDTPKQEIRRAVEAVTATIVQAHGCTVMYALAAIGREADNLVFKHLARDIERDLPTIKAISWDVESYSNDDGTFGTNVTDATITFADGSNVDLPIESEYEEFLNSQWPDISEADTADTEEGEEAAIKAHFAARGIPNISASYEGICEFVYAAERRGLREVTFDAAGACFSDWETE